MHLKRLKITNYKSFLHTTEFKFEPGFNVLLGANSSGKSSVFEAIAFHEMPDMPHRSTLNIEEPEQLPIGKPCSELCFSIPEIELRKLAFPSDDLYIGMGDQTGNFYTKRLDEVNQRLVKDSLDLDIKRDLAAGHLARISFTDWPSSWRNLGGSTQIPALHVKAGDGLQIANFSTNPKELEHIWSKLTQKIYRFSSERAVQATYGHHPDGELLPNSSNLAYCINLLQSRNKDLFETLNTLVTRIFPTIHWIGAPPNGNKQFELKVHTTHSNLNRGDLAVPINQVGTGVGNALAMLYVTLTAQTQRLILLEEPNSFLHPRALRELLAILAEIGGKHQFFVTTHSSDVLRTVTASTVTLLEHDGEQTTVKQTTGKKLHELKAGLVDLGISLTDLHGCDKVIWVEGETEEAIFPILFRHYFPSQAQGIAVLPLYATGDFEARRFSPKKVAEIYKKLSQGSFLAPPMVAIALDREKRREEEMKQIEMDCAGVVHFLPKTMLEDYFLNATAIHAVLIDETANEVSLQRVEDTIARVVQQREFLLNPQNPKSNDVHAAKVLNAVFLEIGCLEYHKTAHGPQIVDWLLANEPSHLVQLKEWLENMMQVHH